MLSNEKLQYTDKEIIEKGAKLLIKELGYSGFLRFIRQFESHTGQDYFKEQKDLYQGMSVDEIFEAAQEHWQNKKNDPDS